MPSMVGPYDPPFDPWNRPPTWGNHSPDSRRSPSSSQDVGHASGLADLHFDLKPSGVELAQPACTVRCVAGHNAAPFLRDGVALAAQLGEVGEGGL